MNLWNCICKIFYKKLKIDLCNNISDIEFASYIHSLDDMAEQLVNVWNDNGYIPKTCKEMLTIPDYVISKFYSILIKLKGSDSPVKNFTDSSWMHETDFSFINIRATGIDNNSLGNFITALKLIPTIRANSIHLGPFTTYDFDSIYAITSVRTISKDVVNLDLWVNGIGPTKQLKAFVEGIHSLGKCVGYDLEPHVTQFSKTAMENPELFRWIALSDDRKSLINNMSQEDILKNEYQKIIHTKVKEIVSSSLKLRNLTTTEYEENDSFERYLYKEYVYLEIIHSIIANGYWTIPVQIWSGYGLPLFDKYDNNNNYPKFIYVDKYGNNRIEDAYSTLTSFSFYNGLAINTLKEDGITINQKAIDFYTNIFSYWRDNFDFDFVRHDSVDHIFDSTNEYDIPYSDRINCAIAKICTERAKSIDKPYIGNLAEYMHYDIVSYSKAGYDVILCGDMLENINYNAINKTFKANKDINTLNLPTTMCFAVDTHDTGDWHLWGVPIVKKEGRKGIALRLFVSRFINVGVKRPKYEVIGVQDLSYGLFISNVSTDNLHWIGNKAATKTYNYIEDIYEANKSFVKNGYIFDSYLTKKYCWWCINNKNTPNKLLIALITVQQGYGGEYGEDLTKIKNTYLPVNSINISVNSILEKAHVNSSEVNIYCYDFIKCTKKECQYSNNNIYFETLPYNSALLFEITY